MAKNTVGFEFDIKKLDDIYFGGNEKRFSVSTRFRTIKTKPRPESCRYAVKRTIFTTPGTKREHSTSPPWCVSSKRYMVHSAFCL